MQGLKELFNKQRVILILCLVILTAAIALFAVSSNSAESLSVFRYTDNNSAAKIFLILMIMDWDRQSCV